jgi:hypothetical protein
MCCEACVRQAEVGVAAPVRARAAICRAVVVFEAPVARACAAWDRSPIVRIR